MASRLRALHEENSAMGHAAENHLVGRLACSSGDDQKAIEMT
jgi:hypothetical protein